LQEISDFGDVSLGGGARVGFLAPQEYREAKDECYWQNIISFLETRLMEKNG
jgi:hypothetical protein